MNRQLQALIFIVLLFSSIVVAAAKFPFPQQTKYPNGIVPSGISFSDVQTVYNVWLKGYYEEQGDLARVKFDTPSQTVSEGIGYGMLIMVYMDNETNNTQPKFDKLWNYWKKFPSSGALMHWKTSGFSSVVESGSATDGDIDAACALVLAYKQWGDEKYLTGAKAIMAAIKAGDVSNNLLDGGDQWSAINPSYMSTVATQIFQDVDPSGGWGTIQSSCYSHLKSSQNGTTGLWPNWTSGSPAGYNCPPCYGFDAARIPWRLGWAYAWYAHADAKTTCSKIVDWFKTKTSDNPGSIGQHYNQDGSLAAGGSPDNIPTFLGPLVIAGMVDAKYQTWVDKGYTRLRSFGMGDDKYYNECIELLSMLLLSGNMPDLTKAEPKTTASITVTVTPAGSGKVTVSPQKTSYTRGETVTLTAVVEDTTKYAFVSWGGDYDGSSITATVKVVADMNITATFKDKQAMDFVDDCEDGNAKTFLKTSWFTFNDSTSKGKSTITPLTSAKTPFKMTAGGYKSEMAAMISYKLDKGSFTGDPFVGVGFMLDPGSDPVDVSKSTGINFVYKGTFSNDTSCAIKIESNAVTEGGASYAYFLKTSSTWKEVSLKWADFTQPKWAKPANLDLKVCTKIQWQIQANSGSGELWLDDIRLVGFFIDRPLAIAPSVFHANNPLLSNVLSVRRSGADWSVASTVTSEGMTSLALYGLDGRRVATLMQGHLAPGTHWCTFTPQGIGIARGSYLLSLVQGGRRVAQPVIIDR